MVVPAKQLMSREINRIFEMIIDFKQQQIQRFLAIIQQLEETPERYQFSDVADFFQADWRQALPAAADYSVSGLDDGAEDFAIRIDLYGHCLMIDCHDICTLRYIAAKD